MPLAIYPLTLSPAAVGYDYDTSHQPITAVGGVAPYTWSVSGDLPVGLSFNGTLSQPNNVTAAIAGRPYVADQYTNPSNVVVPGPSFVPYVVNPSTFTVSVTDSTTPVALTATQQYTIPVGLFGEDETISIYEMLKACYGSDWYIVMSDLGTRTIRIGDIGNAAFGGIRLCINAYLNSYTNGMVRRMRKYIEEFDKIKLIVQEQKNGSVDGVTGINNSFKEKVMKLLEIVKTILPAMSRAEVEARQAHHGGSDFTGSVTGAMNGSGFGSATLER